MKANWIAKAIVFMILKMALGTFLLMVCWNYLFPGLFHWPMITFFQALVVLILSRILFPGHGIGMMKMHWRRHWEQKMASMSPEEKERFRAEWEKRCKHWSSKCDANGFSQD